MYIKIKNRHTIHMIYIYGKDVVVATQRISCSVNLWILDNIGPLFGGVQYSEVSVYGKFVVCQQKDVCYLKVFTI